MVQKCLICGSLIDGDEAFYQHHLNRCLDSQSGHSSAGPVASVAPPSPGVQAELARGWTAPGPTQHKLQHTTATPSASPTVINGHSPDQPTWVGHDLGKHQIDGSKGLIPVLGKLLDKSHAAGKTRMAYLCDPAVEHVARGLVDITWGCGYRNAQMLFSSLRALDCYATVHPSATGTATPVPTILELQTMIEHAWAVGHDPDGAKHFKYKLRKSIKWVGTTEIYTAFTWLGIRARIVDFPKQKKAEGKPAHDNLVSWLKAYFASGPPDPAPSSDATTPAKRSAPVLASLSPNPVRHTSRQPVYLQHDGHSRTVVGIDSSPTGDWLLLFDPGKNVDGKLRKAGETARTAKRARTAVPPEGSSWTTVDSGSGSGSDVEVQKRKGFGMRLGKQGGEEDGLVLERYGKLLDPFRVSLSKLGRHDEYQIMYVEEGPVLTAAEKQARWVVKSTAIL